MPSRPAGCWTASWATNQPFPVEEDPQGTFRRTVQSVAVRLVVDREGWDPAFKPEEYWTLEALLQKQGVKAKPFWPNTTAPAAKSVRSPLRSRPMPLKAAAEKSRLS